MAMIYLILINPKWTTVEKLELIHALKLCPYGKAHLFEQNQAASAASCWLRITKLTAGPSAGGVSFKRPLYQLDGSIIDSRGGDG